MKAMLELRVPSEVWLIVENDTMDAKTLPQVKMPNRDNFIMPYPDRI